ncbi:NACHT domain-containing protein [Enterobacter roggenkampii]|uniref:NACHT domain-containing protein n=3 Tax=Enterobacter roggenkampii TaxID=1812935 RepID=UPI000A6E8976|nr:toll-Interleukin receptor [Enterobacter roggenkampii]MCU3128021.1 ATP-binding protein [Enterobacter roggenkampii]WIJ49111.1 ATP-binding protein [Enterobacter roggenkampii]WIJ77088.1 ATP-binding protein [Enterobacter roggenkampii]
MVLTHRSVDKINLSDIYVSCDMQPLDYAERNEKITSAKVYSSNVLFEQKDIYLISGEEQQGKTTLLKQIYKELLKKEIQPVYFDAKGIKSSELSKCFDGALAEQYENSNYDEFIKVSQKAILIDDLDQIGLNNKYRGLFLSAIKTQFDYIIATCNSSFTLITAEIPELNNYKQFELRGFGHQKRAEIVEKWVALGVEESISEEVLFEECDDFNARLDAIIRKNIVPPKPIYVLILLQMFEAYTQQNLELTSHGHCYQQLVYQAFDNSGIPKKEFDRYLNVLTELAWAIHTKQGGLNSDELDIFFDSYKKIYLGVDEDTVIGRLRSNSILTLKNGKTDFKYPYLFYFFAAKKIAESYTTDNDVCEKTKVILNNLHREDYANILVFVTHHTKDKWVLESIQTALSCLFDDQKPAVLSTSQLTFLGAFIAQIPGLIMEQREVRDERKKHHELLDDIERNANELDAFEENDILAKINKTFKGMEIAGQIVRNRHATLTREALLDLTVKGADTGLRFLNYFICLSDIAKHEVVKLVELTLSENPNFTNEQIKKEATKFFLQMTYGVINGVIRKIASSIGSKEASEIYDEIGGSEPTPAEILLKQAIQLQFKRKMDVETIAYTVSQLQGNPVCIRILKEMIIQHVYMFPVDYRDKQRIDAMLELSVKQQQLMDSKRRLKG